MAGLNTRKKTRLMMTMMTIDYVDHGDHDYDHVYDHLGNDDDQLKGSNFLPTFPELKSSGGILEFPTGVTEKFSARTGKPSAAKFSQLRSSSCQSIWHF